MSSIKDFAKEQSLKKYPVNGGHTEIYQKGIIVGANFVLQKIKDLNIKTIEIFNLIRELQYE